MNTDLQASGASIPVCVEFVLDETGSMGSCKTATINGFNEFLKDQKNVPGLCQMTLTKFEGNNLRIPYADLLLDFVPEMNSNTFVPGGGTNLYDAILARIAARQNTIQSWTTQPNVLFVVMTDGADNISRAKIADVEKAIRAVQQRGWTCVYLGPSESAIQIGGQMGFVEGNIKSFASDEMQETMRSLSSATTAYRSAVSIGATQNFF